MRISGCAGALVAGVLLAGCSSPGPQLMRSTDAYTGADQIAFGPIEAPYCERGAPWTGYGSLSYVKIGGGPETLSLRNNHHTWLFLEAGHGLDMLIDGESVHLDGMRGSELRTTSRQGVTERVIYELEPGMLDRIVNAGHVQFRAIGSRGQVERCLFEDQIAQFRELASQVER